MLPSDGTLTPTVFFRIADNPTCFNYRRALYQVWNYGETVKSRAGDTHEVQGLSMRMKSSQTFVRPHMARALGWLEACAVLSGTLVLEGNLKLVAPKARWEYDASSQYGPRVYSQLPDILAMLHDDENTRRAIIHIGGPFEMKNARACVDSYTFELRYGVLHLHAYVRSWDMISGFVYDTMVMGLLTQYVARLLDVIPGYVHAYAASAHIYDKDEELWPEGEGLGRHFQYVIPSGVENMDLFQKLASTNVPIFEAAVAPEHWLNSPAKCPFFIQLI